MKHISKGFTLIELMICVAIVAALAVIALPSYQAYVAKGRRADGRAALMALLQAQEQYRANCSRYASTLSTGSDCEGQTIEFLWLSPDRHYTLSIIEAGPTGFTAHVEGQGAQAADQECRQMRLRLDRGNIETTPKWCW